MMRFIEQNEFLYVSWILRDRLKPHSLAEAYSIISRVADNGSRIYFQFVEFVFGTLLYRSSDSKKIDCYRKYLVKRTDNSVYESGAEAASS